MSKRRMQNGKWKNLIKKSNKKLVAVTLAGAILGSNMGPITVSAWTARTPEQIAEDLGHVEAIEDLSTYNIQYGDTLWGMSMATGYTVHDIATQYGILNPSFIIAGRTLSDDHVEGEARETNEDFYTVTRGDTLWAIAEAFGTTVEELALWNNIQDVNSIFPGERFRVQKTVEDETPEEETTPPVEETEEPETPTEDNDEDSGNFGSVEDEEGTPDTEDEEEEESIPVEDEKEEETPGEPEEPETPEEPEVPTEPEEPVEGEEDDQEEDSEDNDEDEDEDEDNQVGEVIDVQKIDEEEVIPHDIIRLEDDSLPVGQEMVEQQGSDGKRIYTYQIKTHDTGEVTRELAFEYLIDEPVDTIIRVGTKMPEIIPDDIVEVTQRQETLEFSFETVVVHDSRIPIGEEVITQKGVNGIETLTINVNTHEDGSTTEEVAIRHIVDPIHEYIHVGTKVLEEGEDYEIPVITNEVIDIQEETRVDELDYQTITVELDELEDGEEVVLQEGVKGEVTELYHIVTYDNGEVREVRINYEMDMPKDRIVGVGTKKLDVTPVNRYTEELTSDIPYEVYIEYDEDMPKGDYYIASQGYFGERIRRFEVVEYSDGSVDRVFVEEEVREPIDKIIRVGTAEFN